MKKLKLLRYLLSLLILLALSGIPSWAIDVQIGTGTDVNASPMTGYWGGERSQFIFTAEEITANGGLIGFVNSISLKLSVNEATDNNLTSFSVKVQNTTLSTFSAFVNEGWTTAYDAAFTLPTAPGWIPIPFTTPFMWDGTSNLLVEVCWAIGTTTRGGNTSFEYTTTATELYRNQNEDSRTSCSAITGGGSNTTSRPNVILGILPASIPYLTLTPSTVNFGYLAPNAVSEPRTVLIGGNNLEPAEGELNLTLPLGPGFEVSIDGGATWLTESAVLPYISPIETGIPVEVRYIPTAEENYSDSILISGGSVNTKIKLFGTSVLQYCVPNPPYTYGADIASVTVGSNFNNTSQPISPVLSNPTANQSFNDYRFTAPAINAQAGASVPYSLNLINNTDWTSTYYVKVYVDINRDAAIDAVTELVDSIYVNVWPTNGVVNGIMDIPPYAVVGQNTLIRFVLVNQANATPCNMGSSYAYREVEDYWINLSAPNPWVNSTPRTLNIGYAAPGATSGNGVLGFTAGALVPESGEITATASANFEVSLDGETWASSVSYPYTDAAMTTSSPVFVHFISPVIPSDITGTVTFAGGGVNNYVVNVEGSGNTQYCAAGFASGDGNDIANITVSNLVNYGVASAPTYPNANAIGQYTNNFSIAPIVQLRAGVPYQFTANVISSYTYTSTCTLKVYVDYNANGLFTDENEQVLNLPVANPANNTAPWTVSGEFMVPGDLVATELESAFPRMRVVLSTNSDAGPCTVETSQYTYGEVEDYKVQILPAIVMTYASTTTEQVGKDIIGAGYIDQKMLRVKIATENSQDPLTINQMVFNTNGTIPTASITNAKLFSTGASTTFATTTQVGETVATPDGAINFTFTTPVALGSGNNYYWLAYSVAPDASLETVLDAELTGLYISDEPEVNKIITPQAPEGFSLVNKMKFDGSFPVAAGTTFPQDGWTNIGDNSWRTVTTGGYPVNGPHTAPAMAEFDSWNIAEDATGTLVSPVFAMNGEVEPTTMSLWLYRGNYSTSGTGSLLKVSMSTTATGTEPIALNLVGTENVNTINVRYNQGAVTEAAPGWYKYTYQIPATFNTATNYLLFEGTSDWYNNIHLDDVTIGEDAFMRYAGLDTLNTGMNSFTQGSTNNLVNGFNVRTKASNSPFSVSNVKLTAEGTTNIADIENAVVWYLGGTPTFNPETNVLFGTIETITAGEMTILPIDGADPVLLGEGNNYFAISFDVTAGATPGNVVDCRLNSFTYSRGETSNTVVVPNGNTWGAHEIKLPMNGTYTIGGTPLATRWYPTLNTAIDDLNLLGIDADVDFAIAGDLTLDPTDIPVFLPINNIGEVPHTLTIYPTTNVTITGSYTGTSGMIIIGATDNFVIDGRINQTGERGLTFVNTLGGRELFLTTLTAGGSVDNATIQYCNFVGNDKTNGNALLQIYSIGHTNININHCDFKKSYEGLNVSGATTASKVLNLTVENNTFGDALVDNNSIGYTAMDLNYIDNLQCTNNTIDNINNTGNFAAIMINNEVINANFSFNKINKIINSGSNRTGGIFVNSVENSNIIFANNSIRGINSNATGNMTYAPNGFYFNAGGNYKLFNNSVKLEGNRSTINSNVPNTPSAVVYVESTVTALDIRNNIFVNELVSTIVDLKNYGIYCAAPATAFTNLDYNNYYVTGNSPFIGYLVVDTLNDRATIEDWRTVTGRDAASFNNKVTFEPGSAMHLSGASACNTNLDVAIIESAESDVDGLSRGATTKMGVDEVFAELTINTQPPAEISQCIVTGQENIVSIPVGTFAVSNYSDGISRTLNVADFQISWTKNNEPFAGTGNPLQVLYTAIPPVADVYQATVVTPETVMNTTTVNISEGPSVFTLSGTGVLCPNSTAGVDFTLSGSQIGINYELMLGADLVTAPVAGTGDVITFTNITGIGTYEVYAYNATNSACSSKMLGAATITSAPVATAFAVTGGGSICSGSTSALAIGLASSQANTTYKLYLNNTTLSSTVAGTGSALSFGTYNTAGTYTVTATLGTCETAMLNSVSISTTAAPTAFAVTGGGVGTTLIGLTSSEADVTYTLLKDNVAITPAVSVLGTGSAITFGTFTEVGTYTAKAIRSTCETAMTGSAIVTAAPTGYTLSGTLKYANTAQTAMNNCTVIIKNGTTEVTRTTTDATGNYTVTGLANGTYSIEVLTTKTAGGVNSLDVLPLKQRLAGTVTLTPIKTKAADINNNGSLNSLDILPLKQKLAGQVPPNWQVPSYVFYPLTVTINAADATLNIQSLCGGDINGSFAPANN